MILQKHIKKSLTVYIYSVRLQLFAFYKIVNLLKLLFSKYFVFEIIAGKLVVKPRDTDVKVNHSTYLNCSTDYASTAIFWFHGKKYVYTGNTILEPYNERFAINRNTLNGTNIYNLVIHSVQPEDAGEYICAEDEGVGEHHSVQLVVLGGHQRVIVCSNVYRITF